jgi:hypothetical protein
LVIIQFHSKIHGTYNIKFQQYIYSRISMFRNINLQNLHLSRPSVSVPFVLNLCDRVQWTGMRPCKWPLLLSCYCMDHCQLSQTRPLNHISDLQEMFCIAITIMLKDHNSSIGIATRYGLDGPGIESQWGKNFPHPSRPALGPTQSPIQWVPGLSQG